MGDKLIIIPNDDIQDYPFCRLKLFVKMNIHWTKMYPKFLSQWIRGHDHKTLGTTILLKVILTIFFFILVQMINTCTEWPRLTQGLVIFQQNEK